MGSLASELRFLGVAAALGSLLVMMFAREPNIASVTWGLAGLVFFGATRLVPDRKPAPVIAKNAVAVKPTDTMHESEAEPPVAAVPADVHAALQRKVRLTPTPNPIIASSVLPRSRVARSPATT
ncbi:hypothetical protein E4V01_11165 [Methylorubrum sp. Q1]|uniref:hypothetical protein n=1 Tax=Methylorubrum sp. Q1 TaxID=2562453 RepID=UPI001075F46B|nr:hypothetical protein [Methylorubrum sp. Q1]TFZ58715.1 hypothetical protein E4V01_11165 [Methylorubrum sp. Q1]